MPTHCVLESVTAPSMHTHPRARGASRRQTARLSLLPLVTSRSTTRSTSAAQAVACRRSYQRSRDVAFGPSEGSRVVTDRAGLLAAFFACGGGVPDPCKSRHVDVGVALRRRQRRVTQSSWMPRRSVPPRASGWHSCGATCADECGCACRPRGEAREPSTNLGVKQASPARTDEQCVATLLARSSCGRPSSACMPRARPRRRREMGPRVPCSLCQSHARSDR